MEVWLCSQIFPVATGYIVAQLVYLRSVLRRTSEQLDYRTIHDSFVCLRGPTRMLLTGIPKFRDVENHELSAKSDKWFHFV